MTEERIPGSKIDLDLYAGSTNTRVFMVPCKSYTILLIMNYDMELFSIDALIPNIMITKHPK